MARRNARSVSESIVVQDGSLRYLGTIDFTSTSRTNAQATTPFNDTSPALAGKHLILQTSQDVYILPVQTSTGTVTSTNGFTLYAGETKSFWMDDFDERAVAGEPYAWLAALRVSADGNLKVWELK